MLLFRDYQNQAIDKWLCMWALRVSTINQMKNSQKLWLTLKRPIFTLTNSYSLHTWSFPLSLSLSLSWTQIQSEVLETKMSWKKQTTRTLWLMMWSYWAKISVNLGTSFAKKLCLYQCWKANGMQNVLKVRICREVCAWKYSFTQTWESC